MEILCFPTRHRGTCCFAKMEGVCIYLWKFPLKTNKQVGWPCLAGANHPPNQYLICSWKCPSRLFICSSRILSTKICLLRTIKKKTCEGGTPQPTQTKSDAQGFCFTADPSFPTSNSSTFADATRSVTVSRTSRKSKHQAHELVLEDLDESTTFLRSSSNTQLVDQVCKS